MKAPSISWPTRDHWANWPAPPRQPRHPDGHLSTHLSALASSDEINQLSAALERVRDTQAGLAKRRVMEALKKLRNNTLPYVPEVPAAQRLLEPLRRRCQAANDLHKQAWSRHRDDRPVDDAAWELELQRRAAIESEFAAAWTELLQKTNQADEAA